MSSGAVVFVNLEAVESRVPFWQSRVYAAWRLGSADSARLSKAWSAAGGSDAPPQSWEVQSIRSLIARLRLLAPTDRLAIVESLEVGMAPLPPQMLSPEQLRRLPEANLAVGAHGVTHEALAESRDGISELAESRAGLSALLGAPVETMSFPHGSYDAGLMQAALREFKLVFTSDAWLNRVEGGRLVSRVVGRIGITTDAISGPDGRLRKDLLALWLFRRPRAPELERRVV